MRAETDREKDGKGFWHRRFGAEIPKNLGLLDVLKDDVIIFKEEIIDIIRLEHTGTNDSTYIWMLSIKLAVSREAVYHGMYPYLNKSKTKKTRNEWRATLDNIEKLKLMSIVDAMLTQK